MPVIYKPRTQGLPPRFPGSIVYLYECIRTENLCLFIEHIYDVKEKYKEGFDKDKVMCKFEGWYGGNKKYPKDFDLEE